ncbi:MAG TPA: MGMT family protein [Segeticoccus sp.]|uniref:MGMT family protein n=1 Tax=Segeticoccus sp. TaxID=2706531 RepID=UPI002D7E99DD|nr:MGMT family protein [Segeticoccus sp.]HET8599930.1 MGMT family protein [Segeticoccus sp.]
MTGEDAVEDLPSLPAYAEDVLDVVDTIPPGCVLAYGDVARLVGRGGPRGVGRVMAHYGALTSWWRVIRADGRPPPHHEREALAHYRQEGTPLRGDRVDMTRARPPFAPHRPV